MSKKAAGKAVVRKKPLSKGYLRLMKTWKAKGGPGAGVFAAELKSLEVGHWPEHTRLAPLPKSLSCASTEWWAAGR